MGLGKKLIEKVYRLGSVGYAIYKIALWADVLKNNYGSDRAVCLRKYKRSHGETFDIDNPQTLNQKIFWLKLYDRRPIHKILADKYTVREYLAEHFGSDKLIPLYYKTTDWKDISLDVIPDEPCIIKPTHSSGEYEIIRDKSQVNIKKLRFECRCWLSRNYYMRSQEWQYKDTTRRLIIEKLLLDKNGHIPNDYKLHFINGKLEFVYCSVGRESVNKRNIYDANWNPLYFTWVEGKKDPATTRGEEIPAPESFDEMKRIGGEIAKDFDYVRVDFYDVDGKLYYGEVTFFHGGGNDIFTPKEYDLIYGEKLKLTKRI